MECIFDTCICGILFWAIGYSFMFSEGNGFIGYHWFFLQGAPDTYETTGIPILAHWIFQFAFADTTSTVTSGAMIGRTSFRGDILYSIGVTGFIYPIIGHWAWGPDGWLNLMGTKDHFYTSLGQGFRDFAGSTVVHTIGGMVSLAGAIVLGPRIGRVFKRDGGGMPAPHNLTIAAVGGFILWFGWYGFNPGSTLSAVDMQGIGRVAANTTLAACGGGISAMYMALWFGETKGKFDLGFTTNGFLAGLVAITCPCYWVSPFGAILLGLVAGIVVWLGINLLEWLRVDDPIGAVAVHGFAGIWGTPFPRPLRQRAIRSYRPDRSRQFRPGGRPLLRRRTRRAEGSIHRQFCDHRLHFHHRFYPDVDRQTPALPLETPCGTRR